MWVCYDFETSTRELLGQVTAYSFHLIDENWDVMDRLTGYVQLNRTEIPDLDATLITQLDPSFLNQNGRPEPQVARLIFQFLSNCVTRYGTIYLVGYNANQFDLKFLRSLLIRHGYNPYFYGKIKNIDAYHFTQHIAISYPDTFPWQADENGKWQFKLETIAKSFGLLTTPQRHDADADVVLLKSTLAKLTQAYRTSLTQFFGFSVPDLKQEHSLLTQKAKGIFPEKVSTRFWLVLHQSKSELIIADVVQAAQTLIQSETDLLNCCRYINPNTHFFHAELSSEETVQGMKGVINQIIEAAHQFGFSKERYFELRQPDWDIQYRIHDLGFERIGEIGKLIRQFKTNWADAISVLNQLWQGATTPKDQFMVQLLNRYLMNHSPYPSIQTTKKYAVARYVRGTLMRDKSEFKSVFDQLAEAKARFEIEPSDSLSHYIEYVSDRISALGIGPESTHPGQSHNSTKTKP